MMINSFNKSLFILISVISTSYLIYMEDSKIFVRRILDNSYIVKVGLISYSVYLWHFPIFAIARANDYIGLKNLILDDLVIKTTEDSNLFLKIILIVTTLIISFFSYLYVEKYFRNFSKISSKKFFQILLLSLSSYIHLLIICYLN